MTTLPDRPSIRLLLLRHGHIANYRGDVSLTDEGTRQAHAAGAWYARQGGDVAALFTSHTNRARQTAVGFAAGYRTEQPDAELPVPEVRFSLRNPDLYLGGDRVNMTATQEAYADQSDVVTGDDVLAVPWYGEFMASEDRVGRWVADSNPPGDTALEVAHRIAVFTRSLAHVPAWRGRTVIGCTHSPILRAIALAFLGGDAGEPAHLHGHELTLRDDGALVVTAFRPDTEDG